jgi:hypothetical protein
MGTEAARPLSHDPVGFIEAATGRRPLPEAHIAALGRLAARFPLIS